MKGMMIGILLAWALVLIGGWAIGLALVVLLCVHSRSYHQRILVCSRLLFSVCIIMVYGSKESWSAISFFTHNVTLLTLLASCLISE